ncbi:deoxyribodipyrimidine photo-lyase [Candidatus Puniceispirillum sp.]|nr:deoxyribodipyrimidine photo-lyase [Candidatus Puniceispirillum sp.]
MQQKIIIVWFKRDLRVSDHAPLFNAVRDGAAVLPLFVVEPEYWQLPTSSRRQWCFVYDCLKELDASLTVLGQGLIIRIGAVTDVLSDLEHEFEIDSIYAHEETGDAFTYARDRAVMAFCLSRNIQFCETPANGVVRRLQNRNDWAKIRSQRMLKDRWPRPDRLLKILTCKSDLLPSKDDPLFGPPVPSSIEEQTGRTQTGGRKAAMALLESFLMERSQHYIRNLASPSNGPDSSMRLSPHLAWGVVSSREVEATIRNYLANPQLDISPAKRRGCRAVSSRLAWRCHFIQKLEDQPDIEFTAMHPLYDHVRDGTSNDEYLTAWMLGRTGYPMVDACMRALIHHGWITFRMRAMLVSFASYHLWLDWRLTAPYMAGLFTDYEPGIHYSQFQMQSGVTGINTIRIYNPIKQSTDHDPDGNFLRRWLPELAGLPPEWIHQPFAMPQFDSVVCGLQAGFDYPPPIVDNALAMRTARERIHAIRKNGQFKDLARDVHRKLGSRKTVLRKRKPKQNKTQLRLI